jgi:hypothetical protein
MGVSIPSSFDFGIDLGLDISGIPTNYNIGITQLPKINLGMDIKVDPLEIKPLDMSFEIKPLPPMRVWLPMDYRSASLCSAPSLPASACAARGR